MTKICMQENPRKLPNKQNEARCYIPCHSGDRICRRVERRYGPPGPTSTPIVHNSNSYRQPEIKRPPQLLQRLPPLLPPPLRPHDLLHHRRRRPVPVEVEAVVGGVSGGAVEVERDLVGARDAVGREVEEAVGGELSGW